MSMIKVENLTFAYPGSYHNVFENCTFHIDTSWKLGFVGRNGRGKTTLLKLLMGEYEYSGKIISSVEFDYFPYPVSNKGRATFEILSGICPAAEEWEFLRELSYLDVSPDALYRPFMTLSNGEQSKALLAALFLNEGHFLLIDEPTNHLDADARELVSRYLRKKKSYILVSHDRYFLDGCVDHILSLNRATVDVQNGNFSAWLQNFEQQQSFEKARDEHLRKDVQRLKQASRRTADWSDRIEASKYGNGPVDRGSIGHRAAKMMKCSKTIEARQMKAIKEKSALLKNTETAEKLKIHPLVYYSETLASLSHAAPAYNGSPVCEPVSFEIRQGERTALTGRNGSGKSSILKLLDGQDIPHTGTVSVGSGLVISYVPQDTSFLKGTLDRFAADSQIDGTLFKTILRKLGFERIQFEKDMEDYSAGQKKKVLIAKSLCEEAHLYIWDEPLNFIDIYSRMQIEQLLQEYASTMVFVEHDRAFRELAATQEIPLQPIR